MDKIIIFKRFYNPIEANIVQTRLEDGGVHCFLTDENTVTLNPLYNQAMGGVKLHLFEQDLQLATDILAEELPEVVLEEIEDSAGQCPVCGSTHVGYVQATKERFGIFTILLSLALFVYPFHTKKAFHCFNCRHEF